MDASKTGKLIREMRIEKGLTQQGLAEAINVSSTAISKWENGHSLPDISMLETLSEVLGVSITEIVVGQRNGQDHESAVRSVIEESVNQRRKKIIRSVFITAAICCILIALLFFPIFHGFSAKKDDVIISTGIEKDSDDTAFWVIRFESRNGHGLNIRSEQDAAGGAITLYVYETVVNSAASDSFSWGYSLERSDNTTDDQDRTIRIVFGDDEITYSMREEGVFDER